MRVALVDDHAVFRTAVAQCLSTSGVEVPVSAANGDQLLAGLREHHVDVAVIDISLADGETDGIAVARAVKTEFRDVAILVLSAYAASSIPKRRPGRPGRPVMGWVTVQQVQRAADVGHVRCAGQHVDRGVGVPLPVGLANSVR